MNAFSLNNNKSNESFNNDNDYNNASIYNTLKISIKFAPIICFFRSDIGCL